MEEIHYPRKVGSCKLKIVVLLSTDAIGFAYGKYFMIDMTLVKIFECRVRSPPFFKEGMFENDAKHVFERGWLHAVTG